MNYRDLATNDNRFVSLIHFIYIFFFFCLIQNTPYFVSIGLPKFKLGCILHNINNYVKRHVVIPLLRHFTFFRFY